MACNVTHTDISLDCGKGDIFQDAYGIDVNTISSNGSINTVELDNHINIVELQQTVGDLVEQVKTLQKENHILSEYIFKELKKTS